MHSREENRTQVGKRKTKHAHCRPKYTWSLEDCEQKQLLTHYGVASKTTIYEHMRINNTRTRGAGATGAAGAVAPAALTVRGQCPFL